VKKFKHKHAIVQFSKKSPIDTSKLKHAVQQLYSKLYSDISIDSIEIHPRSYIATLPANYTINFQKKAPLACDGIVSITTPKKRKIFFNYHIEATVSVLRARETIQKDEELSTINTRKKSIILKKFYSIPIQHLPSGSLQAKHRIAKEKIITQRDVVALWYVRRGDTVSLTLKNQALFINMSAKALQNGRIGEYIQVRTRNGKKLKAKVVGKNRVEVQ
jgi:flagella basal body P-ring formation protein FlgA